MTGTNSSPKHAGGRPSDYTQELADEICERLSEGVSLRKVCEANDMPSARTIFTWFRVYPEFLQQYARAKDESADALADDIQDIANDVREGKLDPNAGRVAGDLKKWSASKLKPKKYGERLDVTSGGEKLPTPIYGGLNATNVHVPGHDSNKKGI